MTQYGINKYTKMLLHCSGADGSTTFNDATTNSNNATAVGNAQVDDSITDAFGGATSPIGSLLLDGTGDYLDCGLDIDFNFGTGDWGIDFWIRPPSLSTSFYMFGTDNALNGYCAAIEGGFFTNAFSIYTDGGAVFGTVLNLVEDTWAHILIEVHNGVIYVFQDGVQYTDGTATDYSAFNVADSLQIGDDHARTTIANPLDGYIQEFRVTKGVAPTFNSDDPLYISSGDQSDGFTPPTALYEAPPLEPVVSSLAKFATPANKVNPSFLRW